MNAAEIAAVLGPAYRCGQWWRCVCPVHGSRTGLSATLALRDGPRGLIVHCHAGCGAAEILTELHRRELLHGRLHRHDAAPSTSDRLERERRVELARRIWIAGRDPRGTPVVQYFASRALHIEPPPCLRWVQRCWHREARAALPAMLARVDGLDGELIGVHRTWLIRDVAGIWRRRDRASLGPIGGGAVRLAPPGEALLVAEGIETALAAMVATGLPGWSALSTSGMLALRLPPAVRIVIILADNDLNGAGEQAAHAAAQRWLAEGRRVRIAKPSELGSDFNDVLLGHAHTPVTEVQGVAA
jgi:putative DNA primase/helicase